MRALACLPYLQYPRVAPVRVALAMWPEKRALCETVVWLLKRIFRLSDFCTLLHSSSLTSRALVLSQKQRVFGSFTNVQAMCNN